MNRSFCVQINLFLTNVFKFKNTTYDYFQIFMKYLGWLNGYEGY